jgi:hypothetical protein
MDTPTAFAAIALAAVSWDGTLTMAGSRALRHSLDYRKPFSDYGNDQTASLLDGILTSLRQIGAQHLMVEAAQTLSPSQRSTAYAMAVEIMRSDGALVEDERNILANLAAVLELDGDLTDEVGRVMDVLHADLLL